MKRRTKALLIGLVLGDGYLNPNSGVALEISHCGKQKEYLEYKAGLIHSLLGGKKPRIHKRKGQEEYKISKGHRYFRVLRKWLYKDKKKIFTKQMLSYLTPEAIALWWMDDGSLCKDKRNGKITAYSLHLYTFQTKEETQIIIDYFKEIWDINFYMIRKPLKNEMGYYLKCRTKEGRKFFKIISPYVLDMFNYKINIRQEQGSLSKAKI